MLRCLSGRGDDPRAWGAWTAKQGRGINTAGYRHDNLFNVRLFPRENREGRISLYPELCGSGPAAGGSSSAVATASPVGKRG